MSKADFDIVDSLFGEDDKSDASEDIFKQFMAGGSDFDSGEIQTTPFAQFGGVAYINNMKRWLNSKKQSHL